MGTTKTITKVGIAVGAAIAAYLAVGAFFAHADAAPLITTSIRDSGAQNTVVTSGLVGSSVIDVVQVASSTSQAVPQGTVMFNTYPNTTCNGTPSATPSFALSAQGFATTTPTSVAVTGLSFKVHYTGDTGNIATDGPCEPLTATSNTSGITTALSSGTITAGASAHDSATLSNVTSNAGGTVTYSVYSDASCQTPYAGAGNVNVTNGVVPNSNDVPFANAGTFFWQVVYHGDANNSAATSTCGSENLTVQATQTNSPTISTNLSNNTITAGASVHDSATLSGQTAAAGGSVTYKVFTDNACTGLFGNAGSQSVTNGIVPDSAPFVFNNPGTYFWQVVYGGDASNHIATSTCGSEILTVQAAQGANSPTISTTLSTTSSTVLTGSAIHDSATLNGETATAGGSVTYKVFTNNTCSALFANLGVKAVTNGVVTDSDPITLNTAGTYYWQAVYGGDANNVAATSTCTNEVLTVANPGTVTPPAGNGTLSGEVFNDKNDNGVMDAGETGLAGFKIHLYTSTNFNGFAYFPVFKTAVTDANGNYSFTGLADGTYSVEQVLKNGWKQTTDDYTSQVISGGAGTSGLNFGDVVGPQGKERGHGTEKHNHKGGNKDDGDKNGNGNGDNNNEGDNENDDTASSTHSWIFNTNISVTNSHGLHLGWLIGKGNQDKGKQGKDD